MAQRPGFSGALFDEIERWSGLGLGMASVASGYSRSRLTDEESGRPAETDVVTLSDLMRVLPGATAVIAGTVQATLFDLVAAVEEQLSRASAAASELQFTAAPIRALHAWLSHLDERFRDEQAQRAEKAAEFIAQVGPETTSELLSRVDMNMVLSDVDMDALVERVTVERVLERVDINSVVSDVITELDTANLLREGTGAIASDTLDSIRTLPGAAGRMAGRVVRRPGT